MFKASHGCYFGLTIKGNACTSQLIAASVVDADALVLVEGTSALQNIPFRGFFFTYFGSIWNSYRPLDLATCAEYILKTQFALDRVPLVESFL